MALSFKGTVTAGLWAILLAAVAYTLFGCKAYMKDDSKFVVTFGTSLEFESVGPKDVERTSEVGVDFQDWAKKPVTAWLIDSDGDGEFDQSGEPNDETVDDPVDAGGG